jgi:transcriptional regulator with XRE-family HTH domain
VRELTRETRTSVPLVHLSSEARAELDAENSARQVREEGLSWFRDLLLSLRRDLPLKRGEFADRLGVPVERVLDWELEDPPTEEQLVSMAQTVGMPPSLEGGPLSFEELWERREDFGNHLVAYLQLSHGPPPVSDRSPTEAPPLPTGPLTTEQLAEELDRARTWATQQTRQIAAEPGATTARRLREATEWLEKREAALRALAAPEPTSARPNFAALLIRTRSDAGMTQRDLSERSGVSQPQISQLERGVQEPRLSTIKALAKALGVDAAALIPPDDSD